MVARVIDARPAGVGDLMIGLWIAEAARSRGHSVFFSEDHRSDIIRTFGHETTAEAAEECMTLGGESLIYQQELQSADVDRSARALRWQRTVGWDFGTMRPQIHELSEEALGWANAMVDQRPTVIIAPRSAYDVRSMPMQKWLRLAWSLHADGVHTIAIDGDKTVVEAFPTYAYGFGWPHIIALLSRSAVVVGNDSGIAHVAATVGVPTVAAMGPTDPEVVFGHCRDVLVPLSAETVECRGCHFSGRKGYQLACDHGCDALHSIPWQSVRAAVLASLSGRTITPIT